MRVVWVVCALAVLVVMVPDVVQADSIFKHPEEWNIDYDGLFRAYDKWKGALGK